MNVSDWLNERQTIHDAATEGPWDLARIHHRPQGEEPHWCWEVNDRDGYPMVTELREDEDDAQELATAIVDAHNTLPKLTAALKAVLELHRALPNSTSAMYPNPLCTCGLDYPCLDVKAIEGALND